ncbi:hypothetical protein GCM10010492_53180 [Saccharothrix mutabilis subsp. mutabilis]|uniref:Thiopeptide-type bacteriocin biosynthesis domain-containing protein n=1 Tax=Saccharothrix mutabilis subsp. mutabilis TaxID=66855 RepID=A0ABP3DZR7_9PSEU
MRFLPLVMVRMPVLPLERFRDLQPDSLDAAGRLWADAGLRDAVRVANPGFARELDRRGAPDRRAALALFRYANRMVTRPTPFGLFAGTGFASWGADGPLRAPRAVRRHERVDAVAVGALVRGTRPDVVGRNPTARVSGTRVVAQPPGVAGRPRSVRRSDVVDAVLAFTASPRPWAEVVGLVRESSPHVPEDKAVAFVDTLVREGFLVDVRRPTAPFGFDVTGLDLPEPTLVDLALDVGDTVDGRWRDPLATALEVLQRIALARRPPAELTRYAHVFAERYGHEEVPVEDVLDDLGGLPARGPDDDRDLDPLRRLVLRRAERDPVVELSLADVAGLPSHGLRPVPSCDVFVQVADGRLVLAPRGVVAPGGRAFSRFAPFDPRVDGHLRDAVRNEREPGTCFAALDYWHDTTVNHAGGSSPYETVLAWSSVAPDALRPADIVVGHRDGRLHLRSRRDGRRVLVRTHHLVGTSTAPPLPDFVHRVSNEHFAVPGWSWGSFADAALRLPRIEVAGVVVSPARWRVDHDDVERWRADVPRFVHVGDGDTRLLLDLDHPVHRGLLRGHEWVEESFLRPDQAGHATEIVVTAVDDGYRPEVLDLPTRTEVAAPVPRLPGDGWWALHLRCDRRSEDAVLAALSGFLPAGRWFFVRYDVPRDHLRVRVRADAAGIDELCAAARLLHGRGLVAEFSVEPYVPEVQRYGGPSNLAVCEELFCVDTTNVVRCLAEPRPDGVDDATFAALSADAFLTALGTPGDLALAALSRQAADPASRAERRQEHEQRRLLRLLLGSGGPRYEYPPVELPEEVFTSLLHMHLNRLAVEPADQHRGARRLLAARRSRQQQ